MSLYGLIKGTGPSGFGYNSTAGDVTEGLDLSDRTVLVTGANSGVGKESARVMCDRGATVYAVARSQEKAEGACADFPGEAEPFVCDLSEPDEVRACVDEVEAALDEEEGELDAIVANAGIMALPELNQKYGYELQFLTNHVGHFILVTGLVDRLADDGRVVMLSSEGHRNTREGGIDFGNLSGEAAYDAWSFYGQSKLANLLFAKELARRFSEDDEHDRIANAVHPGVINTNLARHLNVVLRGLMSTVEPLFLKSTGQGAATQTWAAVHPDAASLNGEYLCDCNVEEPSEYGRDAELAERLWDETEQIVEEL